MHKLRFTFALVIAFVKRFRLLLLLSISFGVVIFLASQFILKYFLPSDVQYVGITGRFHIDELPTSILSLMGEGLTKIDNDGMAQPSLAKSWEVRDNGKTWVFHIDTSKKWHDGKNVSAGSIQYSFQDVVIEKPDDQTIIFKLQSAYAPFPLVVSRPTFIQGLVGTGAWKVTNVSIVSTYVEQLDLDSNSGQHRVIRFYPSEEAAKTAFNLGQVDRLEDVLDISQMENWKTVNISKELQDGRYVAVFLNQRSPLFKENKALRQALSYATDKSQWTGEARAIGPIPSRSWAYNPQVKPYEYDIERAKELLVPILPKEGRLTVKLTTNPTLLPLAEKIAQGWKAIGIDTQVQAATALPDDYDAYLSLYQVSLDPDQYQTWHSTQEETNITHYANQRIDKLLEDGRLEVDREKRRKIYLDFQRFLLEDAPAIFLYHPFSYQITRK